YRVNEAATTTGRDEQGRWLPGHAFAGNGARKHVSVTEVLRGRLDPERLAEEMAYHIFVRHDKDVLMYAYDRLDGRPRQSLETSSSEDDPAVVALRQQTAVFLEMWRAARGLPPADPPITLIEASMSLVDRPND